MDESLLKYIRTRKGILKVKEIINEYFLCSTWKKFYSVETEEKCPELWPEELVLEVLEA